METHPHDGHVQPAGALDIDPATGSHANTVSAPPSASAIAPPPPSTSQQRAVKTLVVAFGLLFLAFWFGVVGFGGWLLGMIGIAELLEHTGGLVESTYAVGAWAGALVLLVVVGLVLRSSTSPGDPLQRPRRRTRAAWLLVAGALSLAAVDRMGLDLPDALTTALLLGASGVFSFACAWAFVRATWRVTASIWRFGLSSAYRAGLVTATATLFLLFASPPTWVLLASGAAQSYRMLFDRESRDNRASGPTVLIGAATPVEVTLEFWWKLAEYEDADDEAANTSEEDVPSEPSRPITTAGSQAADPFARCIQELRFEGQPTEYQRAVRRLVAAGFVISADDIASDKLVDVCAQHARTDIEQLGPYYNASIGNRITDLRRRQVREQLRPTCDFDLIGQTPSYDGGVHLSEIQAVLCQLGGEEQDVIRLAVEGFTHAEVGRMLGISETAARQRLRRAREALRTRMD